MAERLLMLALSPTMDAGTIARWVKKEGESFASGDVLCEVETDKATMDYEASTEGTLLKILVAEGSRAAVGAPIALSGKPGENIAGLSEALNPPKAQEAKPESATAAPPGVSLQTGGPAEPLDLPAGRLKASPLARALASARGVALSMVRGSGPGGRIIKEDIERALEAPHEGPLHPPYAQSIEHLPLSEKRRVIAHRLSESMFSSPHYYLTIIVDPANLTDGRARLNDRMHGSVSLNAFIMKIVAEALRRNPALNASWGGEEIVRFSTADIGLAVALKDGLITPVVRDCGAKGIVEIDSELTDLVERARSGSLKPEEFTGATFTISNLGSYGVHQFTAIINPPGAAILAVGEITREPVVDKKDQIVIGERMRMTLSCDHRVIDGAVAAEFARDLRRIIEEPLHLLY